MMDRVIKETMDLLIDGKGFYMEAFTSPEEDLGFYLYTPIKNGRLAVIFSRLGQEDENHLALLHHLRSIQQSAYVLNIVFTSDAPVPFKEQRANYSEVYVNGDGEFFGHDDVSLSVLAKKSTTLSRFTPKVMLVSLILMALNVLIYGLTAVASGGLDIHVLVLIDFGAKVNELIVAGEYYRLLTSAFLHGDFTHILFNMYALFALGRIAEEALGHKKFLLVYMVSALGGGIMSFFFTPQVSVGASGAVFGLLGAVLIMAFFGHAKVDKRMFPRISLVLFLNLFSGFSSSSIDNFGHIGGLLAGLFITGVLMLLSKDGSSKDPLG